MSYSYSLPGVGLSRRSFLSVGTANLVGLSLANALEYESLGATKRAPASKATNVVLIWLAGGPSTIDMWDMKPHAPEYIRGEFKPVSTQVAGVQVCEHLPRLASVLDRCTLLRSVTHTLAEHGIGTKYLMTGSRPSPALEYPSLGSLAARLLPEPQGVPSYVTLGTPSRAAQSPAGAGFLGVAYNPFEVPRIATGRPLASLPDGFTVSDLQRRDTVLKELDANFGRLDDSGTVATLGRFQERAVDILRSGKTKQALDLSDESERLRRTYGSGLLGQSALAARRLIESGVRFVTINHGGWDTHSDNFSALQYRLLPELDHALAGLISELDERQLLDSTIVYCTGEFGRTPRINDTAGRDHWPRATSMLLAGGGFKRGIVFGATDRRGTEPIADPCTPDDVSATLFYLLGFPPSHRVQTATAGRRQPIFHEGEPIREVLV